MQESTETLLQRLKILGDLTRLRLVALCRQGECSVSELTAVTGQSQPRISQQLKLLCEAGLLGRFRDGKRVFYRVPARGGQRRSLVH
jgi:ArsR family transcriptional regulator